MPDLSQLTDQDVEALAKGDMSSVSDAGLKHLSQPDAPQPGYLQQAARATVNQLPTIGGVVGGILGTPADIVSGPMGNIVGAGIGGALGQSAKGLINSYIDPNNAPKTTTQALTEPVKEGLNQAAWQGGGEIAGKALSGIASYAIPKAVSLFGGVNPQVISEYLGNADRINSSKTIEQLKDISDDFVGKLSSDLADKNLNLSQAQDAFNALKTDLGNKYQTMGYDARASLQSANQTLKDAHTSTIQNTAQDIVSTIQQLRDEVTKGSSKSFDILENDNVSVPVDPIKRQLTQLMNELKIAGKTPIGSDANTAFNQLQSIRTDLNEFPKTLPGPEVKKLIQQLQKSVTYGQNSAEFSQTGQAAIKDLTQSVNERLKNLSQPYREQMEDVAQNTGLLNRISPFADRATGAGLLSRIEQPTQINNRQALQELGNKYNADFLGAANPENLPEHGLVQKAENNLANLRPDIVKQKISGELTASPENAQLQNAQTAQQAAQTALNPFKSLAPNIAGQTQAQQKLVQLAKGKNIELADMFDQLGKMTNTDFIQATKDQNVLAAFNKGAVNGSRRTVLGSVTGYALGGLPGMSIGGQIGFASDYYGPSVTKAILNGALKVSKSPTIRTVMGLDLPVEVKHRMINALANYGGQTMNNQGNGQ